MNCHCIKQAEASMTKKYGVESKLMGVVFPLNEDMVPDERVTAAFMIGRKKVNVAVPFCPFCGKRSTSEATSSHATA